MNGLQRNGVAIVTNARIEKVVYLLQCKKLASALLTLQFYINFFIYRTCQQFILHSLQRVFVV